MSSTQIEVAAPTVSVTISMFDSRHSAPVYRPLREKALQHVYAEFST